MRLRSLKVERLDGVVGTLRVDALEPGVNVIVGRNASGKSSLVRALRAVLYPDRHPGQVAAQLVFEGSLGEELVASRLGDTVEWRRDGAGADAPLVPPAELAGAYLLQLEDIVTVDGGRDRRAGVDAEISERLQLELTGGVDLKEMRGRIPKQKTAGQKEARELRRAARALNDARRGVRELRRQELSLEELRRRLSDAETRARTSTDVAIARELAGSLQEQRMAAETLHGMPALLGQVRGDEVEQVAELRRTLENCRREEARLLEEFEREQELSTEAALPPELTPAQAREQVDLAEELCRDEQRLAQLSGEVAAAREEAEEAWARMGGVAPGVGVAVDAATVDEAATLVGGVMAAAATARELERRAALLEGRLEGATDLDAQSEAHLARLREACTDLTRWLETPPAVRRLPGWALAVAVVLALVSGGIGLLLPSTWYGTASSAALLVWLLISALVLRRSRQQTTGPSIASLGRSLAAAGMSLPDELDHGSAAQLLQQATSGIAKLEREGEERRSCLAERERLRRALNDAQADWRRRREALEALKQEHGFSAAGDAGFAHWLGAARTHARATGQLRGLQAELRELAGTVAARRESLGGFLTGCGKDPLAAGDPGVLVLARCRQVKDQVDVRDAALAAMAAARRQIAKERAVADDASRGLGKLAERLGLMTSGGADHWSVEELDLLEATARRLGEQLPQWQKAQRELVEISVNVRDRRSKLSHRADLLNAAEDGDLEALDAEDEAASQAAQLAERTRDEVIGIEQRIAAAGAAGTLGTATAHVQSATDELEAHRSEAVEIAAAHFLLDSVEDEHEAVAKPAALERAAEWFARFTHGEFELTFEQGGDGWRFGGRDMRVGAGGRRLELRELSTGTRAQLVIAARLAFALESEASYQTEGRVLEPLPFFLDEALTTSDQERFHQIAGAIFDVAEATGRQFIYLSARQEDAELWSDVAAERGASVSRAYLGQSGAATPATA